MYCSILGFNQEKALKYSLDMTDLLLLNYIMQSNGNPTMNHTISEEISYVWLSHKKLKEDLPILNMAESTLKNRLVDLKKKDLIKSVVVANNDSRGSMAYYSVTEKTIDLTTSNTTTYFKTDVVDDENVPDSRPRTSKSTSNNTSINSYINTVSNDTVYNNYGETNGNSKTEFESKAYTEKDEFLGSAVKRKKPVKKNNLFSKCLGEIDAYTGYTVNSTHTALVQYLNLRLAMKDKPLYGVNQWKGLLKRLDEIIAEDNTQDHLSIINQSIERGWASFFPVQKDNRKKKDVFSEFGQVTCKKSDGRESSGIEY